MKYLRIAWPLTVIALACSSGGAEGGGTGGGSNGDGDGNGGADAGVNGDGDGDNNGSAARSGGDDDLFTDVGGNGDAGVGDNACATSTTNAEPTPANLIFVVDQSGSMNCNAPEAAGGAPCEGVPQDDEEPSKWDITSGALADALDALSGLSNVQAGVTTFPLADDDNPGESCIEGSEPQVSLSGLDGDHRTAIDTFLSEVVPSGETPLAGTTILSYAYLAEQLADGQIEGNSFVVLLTDGTETCKPDEIPKLIDEDVPNATLFDIRTFVIGAPGSEDARGILSQMAFEGGTATSDDCDHSGDDDAENVCHFDMTQTTDFAQDLADALRSISEDKTFVCRFDVPEGNDGRGVDLEKVNVTYRPSDGDDVEVLNDPDEDCEDAEGWQYTDDFSQIQLCGDICDDVSSDPEGSIDIVLGCPTQRVVQ